MAKRAENGFTLVEMLVVIAILGILMAMMVPAAGLILKKAKISNTRGDAGIVESTLLKYRSEYNRWPAPYASSGEGETDDEWVEMMGPKPGSGAVPANPKRIVFFEPGGGALDAAGEFVDAWGRPFRFRLDLDGDGQMDNPSGEGQEIRARALAWSAGPDGDLETWEDNEPRWE